MSANVAIVLKDLVKNKTVAVVLCAPSRALKPANAPTQQHSDATATTVDPKISYNGASVEGVSHTKKSNTEYPIKQDWAFHSSNPDSNKAEFNWRRTSPQDDSGLDRSFQGALVLRRAKHKEVALEARVRIQA